MRRRVQYSQKLAIWALRRLLTPRANMNAPIRDAFDCSSRKPMRRHFVSGFPRALLSLGQEKSSGVEIGIGTWKFQPMVTTVACRILNTQRTNSDSIPSRKQNRAVKKPIQHLQWRETFFKPWFHGKFDVWCDGGVSRFLYNHCKKINYIKTALDFLEHLLLQLGYS